MVSKTVLGLPQLEGILNNKMHSPILKSLNRLASAATLALEIRQTLLLLEVKPLGPS